MDIVFVVIVITVTIIRHIVMITLTWVAITIGESIPIQEPK